MSTENVSGILFLVQSACLERRFLDDPALSIEQLNCGQIRISFSRPVLTLIIVVRSVAALFIVFLNLYCKSALSALVSKLKH